MAEELRRYLRGWVGYFGHSQTPSMLDDLNAGSGAGCGL
jgi:Group II intron, maturase-specific domain